MPAPTSTPAPIVILTPAVPFTPARVPIEEVNFTGLVTATNVPSQVQVVFSLRDQEGHAIVLPAERLERALQVHELGPGTDGSWEEIDYTETSYFVHTAENIDLEVVFVLDFTNSMAAARLSDGSSGVDAMLRAFEASLAVLPSAHRIGVVEFHDRNIRPSVLSRLTTDRPAIQERVNDFLASGFDSGSSRVWDSVVTGSDLFSSRDQNPRAVRALVFLSDGRDTSSDSTREQAARYARERGVQLYALGVGNVFQEPELRSSAHSTDGAYYSAHDLNLVQEQLQLLVHDLRGQYQLTYITLRRSGEYQTGITAKLSGVQGSTEVGPFDVARFYGVDNQGIIRFDPPSFDRANQRATAFMRALHIPRNIDRIRFRMSTDKPVRVELAPSGDGGLPEGWLLSGPDADGWYEMTSPTPLAFGSLGLLAKLTFSNVTEDGLDIPIEFDNSIYTGGKTLSGISSTSGVSSTGISQSSVSQYGSKIALALVEDPFPEGYSLSDYPGRSAAQIYSLIFSMLFRIGPSGIEPDLAESWHYSSDFRELEIRLRKDARFHDGRPVTSSDVWYSMQEPSASVPWHAVVTILDDYTLHISFKYPDSYFIYRMADPRIGVIVPKGILERPIKDFSELVGSGPFRPAFVEERLGDDCKPYYVRVLERNPDYYDEGLPYLDFIELVVIPERSHRLAAFLTGEIDYLGYPYASAEHHPPLTHEELERASSDASFGVYPFGRALWFDTRMPPFDDRRVRMAVNRAIDMERLGRKIWAGALQGVVPGAIFPYWVTQGSLERDAEWHRFDQEQARQLLAEAGYPDGFSTKVQIPSRGGQFYIPIAEAVADMLEGAGITVDVERASDDEAYYFSPAQGGIKLASVWFQGRDPGLFLRNHFGSEGAYNWVGTSIDPPQLRYDDPGSIIPAATKLAEEVLYIPLPAPLYARSRELQGPLSVESYDLGTTLRRVWIEDWLQWRLWARRLR